LVFARRRGLFPARQYTGVKNPSPSAGAEMGRFEILLATRRRRKSCLTRTVDLDCQVFQPPPQKAQALSTEVAPRRKWSRNFAQDVPLHGSARPLNQDSRAHRVNPDTPQLTARNSRANA
jgi:hypothetical protein